MIPRFFSLTICILLLHCSILHVSYTQHYAFLLFPLLIILHCCKHYSENRISFLHLSNWMPMTPQFQHCVIERMIGHNYTVYWHEITTEILGLSLFQSCTHFLHHPHTHFAPIHHHHPHITYNTYIHTPQLLLLLHLSLHSPT